MTDDKRPPVEPPPRTLADAMRAANAADPPVEPGRRTFNAYEHPVTAMMTGRPSDQELAAPSSPVEPSQYEDVREVARLVAESDAVEPSLQARLWQLIAKWEKGESHDEGAFDHDCETCLILRDLRAVVEGQSLSASGGEDAK